MIERRLGVASSQMSSWEVDNLLSRCGIATPHGKKRHVCSAGEMPKGSKVLRIVENDTLSFYGLKWQFLLEEIGMCIRSMVSF